jgi:hypothetical protein
MAALPDWYVYLPEQGVIGPMSWKELQGYPRNTLAGYSGGKLWYPRCVWCENGDLYVGLVGMVFLVGLIWTSAGVVEYLFYDSYYSSDEWGIYWAGILLWIFLIIRLRNRLGVSFE